MVKVNLITVIIYMLFAQLSLGVVEEVRDL